MTTGLERTVLQFRAPPTRSTTRRRFVVLRVRLSRLVGHRAGAMSVEPVPAPPPVRARDVRTRAVARPAHRAAPRARDVHDGAVLRGVIPPSL